MDSNDIVGQNLKFYKSIEPKNPGKSYTVLATVNDSNTGKLLALATGTQANLSVYPDDIEDCHAESLVKRAFKRYLINRVLHKLTSENKCLDQIKNELPEKVIFFISQFPCGLIKRYEGNEPVDEETKQVIMRKPGRGTAIDGKIVYVQRENCYTKLLRWRQSGIQGKSLGALLNFKCGIEKLLIGNCESEDDFAYEAHLDRLEDETCDVKLIDFVRQNYDQFVIKPEKQSQPVAIVWWSSEEENLSTESCSHRTKRAKTVDSKIRGDHELVVGGRKRGLTKKQCNSCKDIFKLRISSSSLRKDIEKIEGLLKKSSKSQICGGT